MIACLVQAGRIVKYGINQIRYSKDFSYFDVSLHAEADLIRGCRNDELNGAKVYVYRFNDAIGSDRMPRSSRPCQCCAHMLNKAGVSRVYFIDSCGEEACAKPKDMPLFTDSPHRITKLFLANLKGSARRFNAENYIAA